MRPRHPIATCGIALAAMLFGGGCVTSHSARYQHHLATVVKPERHANQDVAAAFGLQQPGESPVAAGAMRER